MDINGGSSCNEGNVGCDFHRNLQYDNSTEFNGGFDDYVETTVHPGSSLFIATLSFCIASTALLPFFVAIGNKRSKLRKARKLKQNQDCGKQEEDDAIQEVKIEGSGATATTTPIQEIKIEVPSATETTTATPWSSCGNCMVLDCTLGNLGFEEDDNFSFFENIEKHLVDDDISLTQDNAITADGEIATNFCCLGSEVKSDSIPINELACDPDEDSKVISTKSLQKKSRKSDIFQKKRKRSGQPDTMERQLSIMTSDSSLSDSSPRKARQNRKKSRR